MIPQYYRHDRKKIKSDRNWRIFFSIVLVIGSLIIIFVLTTTTTTTTTTTSSFLSSNSMNGGRKESDEKEIQEKDWPHPIIHIVNTRFMQDQAHLTNLSWARLKLFETFCLPTMISQLYEDEKNGPKFLWIIKIDPQTLPEIRDRIITLVAPYPNFYLIGSNINFGVGSKPGGWRDGQAGLSVLDSTNEIYSGNIRLLEMAHVARQTRIILETRLDADDGLEVNFLSHIQRMAIEEFNSLSNQPKWLYWCASRHLEWFADSSVEGRIQDSGSILSSSEIECSTPGITLGMAVGTEETEVKRYSHAVLLPSVWRHGGCGLHDKKKCLRLLTSSFSEEKEKPYYAAVRSRTPTSAGMKDVSSLVTLTTTINSNNKGTRQDNKNTDDTFEQNRWWDVLESNFGIIKTESIQTNQYLHSHLKEIALDNMKGQCTQNHSCKISSKEKLQQMVDILSFTSSASSVSA